MFFRGFERRAAKLESGHPSEFTPSWLVGTDAYSGVAVSPSTSFQNTAFLCGARIRGNLVGQVPLKLYQQRDDGSRAEVREHDAYWLMHEAPSEEVTAFRFRQTLETHRWTWGNCFAEIVRSSTGSLQEVKVLRPDWMDMKREENGRLWYFYPKSEGGEAALSPSEILHVPGLSFNALKGFSPVEMSREAIGLGIASTQMAAAFIGNGAQFGGVFQRPEGVPALDEDAETRFLDAIAQRYQGPQKAGRFLLVQEGTTFQEMGIDPQRAQFIESRQFGIIEIAQILNLPPHVLKDLGRATWGNIEHQYLELLILSALPEYVAWEQELNRKLLTQRERREDRLYFEFVVDGLLRGDNKSRWESHKVKWSMGVPLNRILRWENMDPVDGGDQSYVPANFLAAGTEPEPPPVPRSEVRSRQRRSIVSRLRLREAFLKLLEQAASRLVTAEVKAIRRQIEQLPTQGEAAFRLWVEQFFERHESFARDVLGPVLTAYLEAVSAEVSDEMGADAADFRADIEIFAHDYRTAAARRHARAGQNQILALLDAAETTEAAQATILERLAGWEDSAAGKLAAGEASQALNAASALVYGLAGVLVLRWHWPGSDCKICPKMDGRVVETHRPFLQPGDVVASDEEGVSDLQVKQVMRHPPLHRGCNCVVVPGG